MPLTNADNISIVLSGGTGNLNPSNSLGGDPSSSPITSDVLNNLFADVTPTQSNSGFNDYRCVYLFNDGESAIYNVMLWVSADLDTGAGSVQIGVQLDNCTQRLTITGNATSGTFTLSYNTANFTISHNSDLSVMSSDIQSAISNLLDGDGNHFFHSVSVVAANAGSSVVFDVKFSGIDSSRSFDEFQVIANNLLPTNSSSLLFAITQQGSPINTIAPQINVETTPPGGVNFYVPTSQSPITLPVLLPGDGFPLWVHRIIPAGTVAQENDGITLSFSAESLAP